MKPWWAMRSGRERQLAKADDAKRRGIDDDGLHKYAKLCAKFKLRHDDRIKARMDGDKLALSRGKLEFSLTVDLYTKSYLQKVTEILTRDANARPSSMANQMFSTPIRNDG